MTGWLPRETCICAVWIGLPSVAMVPPELSRVDSRSREALNDCRLLYDCAVNCRAADSATGARPVKVAWMVAASAKSSP